MVALWVDYEYLFIYNVMSIIECEMIGNETVSGCSLL